MIVTIAFSATDGNRDALAAKLLSILPDTRAFNGCNQVIFTESQQTPGAFVLIEDWDSNEQYDAYKTWRRESGTTVLGSDLVDGKSLASTSLDVLSS